MLLKQNTLLCQEIIQFSFEIQKWLFNNDIHFIKLNKLLVVVKDDSIPLSRQELGTSD